jgi:hypothetical protein
MVELGASPSLHTGAPGVVLGDVPDSRVSICGPIVAVATCHDPAGVARSVETRTQPHLDPRTKQPCKFNPNSPAGRRFAKYWRAVDACVTPDAMTASFLELFGEHSLGEIKTGPYSSETMRRAVETCELHHAHDLPTRKSAGKIELTPKQGKDVRSVVNNTLDVFTIINVAGHVLENMFVNVDTGIMRDLSIKGLTRSQIYDVIQARFQRDGCYGYEIDQTAFEAHQRSPGMLKFVLNLVRKVVKFVTGKFSSSLTHKYVWRLDADEKGFRISIKANGVATIGSTQKVTLKFKDQYLDSGFILTSFGNGLNETGAVLSCLVENPEHLFCKNSVTREYRLHDRTFNFQFQPLMIQHVDELLSSATAKPRTVYLRPST